MVTPYGWRAHIVCYWTQLFLVTRQPNNWLLFMSVRPEACDGFILEVLLEVGVKREGTSESGTPSMYSKCVWTNYICQQLQTNQTYCKQTLTKPRKAGRKDRARFVRATRSEDCMYGTWCNFRPSVRKGKRDECQGGRNGPSRVIREASWVLQHGGGMWEGKQTIPVETLTEAPQAAEVYPTHNWCTNDWYKSQINSQQPTCWIV